MEVVCLVKQDIALHKQNMVLNKKVVKSKRKNSLGRKYIKHIDLVIMFLPGLLALIDISLYSYVWNTYSIQKFPYAGWNFC